MSIFTNLGRSSGHKCPVCREELLFTYNRSVFCDTLNSDGTKHKIPKKLKDKIISEHFISCEGQNAEE